MSSKIDVHIEAIRRYYAQRTYNIYELARLYNVSTSTIRWHLDLPGERDKSRKRARACKERYRERQAYLRSIDIAQILR